MCSRRVTAVCVVRVARETPDALGRVRDDSTCAQHVGRHRQMKRLVDSQVGSAFVAQLRKLRVLLHHPRRVCVAFGTQSSRQLLIV